MTARLLAMILCSVGLSAGAQVLFKTGMSAIQTRSGSDASAFDLILAASTNPGVIAGFVAYGASAVIWLFVLGRTEVSVAYPFVGVGFILTMLAGWLLLGENVTTLRVAGTLLVCLGVAMIGASKS
jgi:multidrug transporter EmrE-like cation transporter